MPLRMSLVVLAVLSILGATPMQAAEPEIRTGSTVVARQGVVVTVSEPASRVGAEILRQGGNAVDAAVASAFALAVTWPEAGNIGGGGFMLVKPAQGPPVLVDYREVAPAAAGRETFVSDTTALNHRAVGVPGTVRGLALAHKKFGRLPWKALVLPSVKLAQDGFPVSAALAKSVNRVLGTSKNFEELRRVYGKPGGGDWQAGDTMKLPDLAATLEILAEQGPDAFYTGPIARALVQEMQQGKGLIVAQDLANYSAKIREPQHGTFRGHHIYSSSPPAGGIVLIEMLNILEQFDLKKFGRWSPETLHVMAEASRRAYCDRARYLADPQFVSIPERLTTKEYAQELAKTIDLKQATRSASLAPEIPLEPEGASTTHFSVIDKDGMAVANTYTLEESFGSRIVVRGSGFILNNEMGDFNWQPGRTTRSGQIGTAPNIVAPGKRMLSSQTPTMVFAPGRDGEPGRILLITGSPGGRTIINTVTCVVMNVLEFDLPAREAVDAPRQHQQWFPDSLTLESGLHRDHPELAKALQGLGHTVTARTNNTQGDAHTIWIDPKTGEYHGIADQRREGVAAGW